MTHPALKDESCLVVDLGGTHLRGIDVSRTRERANVLEERTGGGADTEPARHVDRDDRSPHGSHLCEPATIGFGGPERACWTGVSAFSTSRRPERADWTSLV